MARRISINTLGLMTPRSSAGFSAAKRRRPWCFSKPRLLTTCLFFAILWVWFNLGGREIRIPEDSFEYLRDESLSDILNTTLGVCLFHYAYTACRLVQLWNDWTIALQLVPLNGRGWIRSVILTGHQSSKRYSSSIFHSALTVETPCLFPQPSQTSSSKLSMGSQVKASSKVLIRRQRRTSSYYQGSGAVGGHI